VAAINAFSVQQDVSGQRELRAIYEAEYSQEAFKRKLALVLDEPMESMTLAGG
jgi:hypothetical protein